MANRIVDGIIEEAKLKRSGRGQSVYETVTIRTDGGPPETFRKLIVARALRDALEPGTAGRFYLHSFIDQKGLHGVRIDGRARFAFPRNAEKLLGIMAALNLIILLGWIAMDGGVRMLPAIFGPLCLGLYVALRLAHQSAARHIAADAAPRPAVQARSAPATSL